jgi:hypothetical protein
MPETHSKLAIALADEITPKLFGGPPREAGSLSLPLGRKRIHESVAATVDERLAEIRKHYEPEELARCPIVSHHGTNRPCPICICAAMREFILVPGGQHEERSNQE